MRRKLASYVLASFALATLLSQAVFAADLPQRHLYITATSLDTSHHSEIRAGLNYRFGGL